MRRLAVVVALAATAASQPAGSAPDQPAAGGGRKCFYAHTVNGFRAVDDRTVYLRVGVRDVYQLELMGPCPDVDWAEAIGIESRGSSTICTGLDATIIAPSSIGPHRCPVRTVRRLSPQEVEALPPKARP